MLQSVPGEKIPFLLVTDFVEILKILKIREFIKEEQI